MSRRLRLVVAGACALAAAVLCLLYGQGVQAEADAEYSEMLERYGGEVVSIVVATEQLEPGDVISAENAGVEEWVSSLVPDDAYTSLDDVLGLEVTVAAAEGVPLTGLNFRSDGESVEVPEGRVAVSVEADDDLGLSSVVSEGATMVAYEVLGSGVSLLSEDVLVLDLPGDGTTSTYSGTVVLAVLPEDVADVLYAAAEGSLRLVLPGDDVSEVALGTSAAASEVLPVDDADAGAEDVEADDEAGTAGDETAAGSDDDGSGEASEGGEAQ